MTSSSAAWGHGGEADHSRSKGCADEAPRRRFPPQATSRSRADPAPNPETPKQQAYSCRASAIADRGADAGAGADATERDIGGPRKIAAAESVFAERRACSEFASRGIPQVATCSAADLVSLRDCAGAAGVQARLSWRCVIAD